MTRLGHGQGRDHAYVLAGESSPYTEPTTLDHGHGAQHAYVRGAVGSRMAQATTHPRLITASPAPFTSRVASPDAMVESQEAQTKRSSRPMDPRDAIMQRQEARATVESRPKDRLPACSAGFGPQINSGACRCCAGTGEHICGHECYRCDASGDEEGGPPCEGHHGRPEPDSTRLHSEATLSRVAFMPTQRLFGPTYGLDKRLFDGDQLKGDVRKYIYETLATFWKGKHGVDWDEWAIIYLAGSEASEWTSEERIGNSDFDVLVGVDYDKFRGAHARREAAKTDQEITDELNYDFRVLNRQTAQAYIPIDGKSEGPFSNTWYVNSDSYDIRKIKPYAAYDVTNMRWAVKPPHLPKWDISQFPEGPALVAECQAVSAYVRAILNMPEPYRTQQGYALWHHLHSDRARAFGPQGEGWFDPGNVIEKFLDQEGLWEQLVQIMVRVKDDPSTLNAPENWSNDPVLS